MKLLSKHMPFVIFAAGSLVSVGDVCGQVESDPKYDPDRNVIHRAQAEANAKGGERGEPASAPASGGNSPSSIKLKKIQQMTFDRRGSAVLDAWSKKPTPEDPPGSEKVPRTEKIASAVLTLTQATPIARLSAFAVLGSKMSLKDPIDIELAAFHRAVITGEWKRVRDFLATLDPADGKEAYVKVLSGMQTSPMNMSVPPQMAQFGEKASFSLEDFMGVVSANPASLQKETLTSLVGVLRQTLASGAVVENVVTRFQAEIAKPKPMFTKRQAAKLLVEAGQPADAKPFLPSVDQAKADADAEALNLLARHFLGLEFRDAKPAHLENAWDATQLVFELPTPKKEHANEAMKRAVELAPRLKEHFGKTWLERSFRTNVEVGREIVGSVGALVSQGITTQPMNPEYRRRGLQLQKTAVDALLAVRPSPDESWRKSLSLLAAGWLREAEFTNQFGRTGSLGPRMNRDRFGNVYFFGDDDPYLMQMMQRQPNMPRPVDLGEILDARPSDAWLALIDDGLRPKLQSALASLYLKANEEKKAFPYIEKVSATHPDRAKDLAKEFLRAWVRIHDLNEPRRPYNPFYYYGFMSRAESIPLTRSKQERNLVELAEWIGRLQKLPIGELDQELLAKAFSASHSSAEVFRVELAEKIFAPAGGLKPRALAPLMQTMRENLAGMWREPALQKDKKTNRKQKDIAGEILRGYEIGFKTVDDALRKHPDEWRLLQVRAALRHDENNYRQEVSKSSEFSARRKAALADFALAAEKYASQFKNLPDDEHSTAVYEQWFYASLGACDLGKIDENNHVDQKQMPLIKKSLGSLPGDAASEHMTRFVNSLVTRAGGVKAPVKYRYFKAGLDIVGDHKNAQEARKTYEYYKDLVTEIKLESSVDGEDKVSVNEPFGVFVNLRHTKEVERESGGFGRYLQNQNQNIYFSYNFGRPTADYRDRFQTMVHEAMKENFEVLSVTFQPDSVHSRADTPHGWRVTPYAYLLLKPRGPQVDKLPQLRLDLDFLDTSGYVVLPIESPAVPIDASGKAGDRPLRNLEIVQTLDERQAEKSKLVLEIKASARGLIPRLEEIADFAPTGFDIVKVDDPGVAISKFDQESDRPSVVSERLWTITLKAKEGIHPSEFRFAKSKVEGAKVSYQRFEDADLVTVPEAVKLEERYGQADWSLWKWVVGSVSGGLLLVVAGLYFFFRRRSAVEEQIGFQMPERLTPFTVLNLLRDIRSRNGLAPKKLDELSASITSLEEGYFSADSIDRPDLESLAKRWLGQAKAR